MYHQAQTNFHQSLKQKIIEAIQGMPKQTKPEEQPNPEQAGSGDGFWIGID